ncbi:hypothetical protein ACWDUN_11555 [Mycobacterium sp. NPDC003323]
MNTNTLVNYLVPVVVAILTAAGGVVGVTFRDADAYDRRRGMWLWMLVIATGIVTMAAMETASGIGRPIPAAGLTVSACAAAIGTHFLWRRLVPDSEPRTVRLARIAIGLAVAVIISAVTLTYVAGQGCRQAEPLLTTAWVESGYAQPGMPGQGPTPGEVADWAERIHADADKVTAGGVRSQAQRLAGIADEIAAAAADNDWARQALISTEYFDVLGTLFKECRPS